MNPKTPFSKLLLMVLVAVLSILPGCGQPQIDENTMPDVVFDYYEDKQEYDKYKEKRYDIWFIDKEGGLYHVMSNEFDNLASLAEGYKTTLKDICIYVKDIEYEELVEKYKILKEVSVSDKNIVEIKYSTEDCVLGIRDWGGYCFDEKGNRVIVYLHREGDSYYTNEDPRAGELAEWMDAIVQEAMQGQ